MVDRVYKGAIPEFRRTLEHLRKEISGLDSTTDWVRLRVDPLLKHARELERVLSSPRFSSEISRLKRGVSMFHSDLVYFRTNVNELRKLSRRKRKGQRGR